MVLTIARSLFPDFTRNPNGLRVALVALTGFALAGCGKEKPKQPEGPASAVEDSAGVTIVTSTRPAWPTDSGWTLDSTPALVISGTGPSDSVRFRRVRNAVRSSDGRIVVASEGTTQVVFFDSAGRFLQAVGRKGTGPKDFLQIVNLMLLPKDSLLVDNAVDLRILDPQGRQVKTIPEDEASTMIVKFGVLGDGTLVGSDWPQGDEHTTRRWIGVANVYHQRLGSSAQKIVIYPAVDFAKGPEGTGEPVIFSPELSYAVGGDRYCLSYPRRFEINCFSSAGVLTRSIRWEGQGRATPKEAVTQYRDAFGRSLMGPNASAEQKAKQQARLDAKIFADSLPAFDQMRIDRDDHLWVREFSISDEIEHGRGEWNSDFGIPIRANPSRWTVFSPDGRWLGDLTLPARFTPLDIGSDYLMGLARTAEGAESIVVYRLKR